jgi:hypothetical protein
LDLFSGFLWWFTTLFHHVDIPVVLRVRLQ